MKDVLLFYTEMFLGFGLLMDVREKKREERITEKKEWWPQLLSSTTGTNGWDVAGRECHWGHLSQSSRSSANIKLMSNTGLQLRRLQGCSSTAQMATYQLAAKSYPSADFRDCFQTEAAQCLFVRTNMQFCSWDRQRAAVRHSDWGDLQRRKPGGRPSDVSQMKETQKQTSCKYSQHVQPQCTKHRSQQICFLMALTWFHFKLGSLITSTKRRLR